MLAKGDDGQINGSVALGPEESLVMAVAECANCGYLHTFNYFSVMRTIEKSKTKCQMGEIHRIDPTKSRPMISARDSGLPLDTSGGPPDDGDMERLATLEARFDAALPTLATRADIESVKSEIHKSSSEAHRWMLATVIGLFLGFGGLFLAMSNALKPPSQQPAATPIVIYNPPASVPK
jgi:hypothetical protein